MRNNTVRKMAVNAMVAALYFALSLPFMTLIFGPVQLRISEAFTSIPFSVRGEGGKNACIMRRFVIKWF